jgi:hypothetical protein
MTTSIDILVSLVIPAYNKGRFLAEAIDSVLAQSYSNFEIIVVDDGSTDETKEVAGRYSSVNYFFQQNRGVSAARNAGLKQSKGSYVVFLDADDRLLPDALKIGVECLEAHPECAFASGHIRIIDSTGSVTSIPEESCVQKDHYRTLLTYNYIWTPAAVVFRSSIVNRMNGYSSAHFGAEDWDLYLRIARSFPVHCHNQIVAEYRTDGLMTSDPSRMLKDSLAVLCGQRPFQDNLDERACEQGIETARKYYGDPLVKKVQTHLQNAEWKQVLRGGFALLIYYPDGFRKAFFRRQL